MKLWCENVNERHILWKGEVMDTIIEIIKICGIPIVTSLISYFAARNKNKSEINKLKIQHNHEIEVMNQKLLNDIILYTTQSLIPDTLNTLKKQIPKTIEDALNKQNRQQRRSK